jgi:2,4-dienoyl-CoA reductase-like NADH-dependent reductase (Old Yellow Enzyme family)
MTKDDLKSTLADYVATVQRAERVGYDLIEMHGGHGYLMHEFLSPLSNQRSDEYGGSLQKRMRYPLEVFEAMRKAWPSDKPMGIRVSAVDWVAGGTTIEDTVAFARELKALGCDYMDVSSGQLDGRQQIPFAPGYNAPFAEAVRRETGLPTMSVGLIAGYQQAEDIVASGKADFIVIGRGAMWDPRWAWHAAEELGAEAPYAPRTMPCHPKMRPWIFPKRAAAAG